MCTGLKAGGLAALLLAAVIWAWPLAAAESTLDLEKIEIRLPMGVIILNANSLFQASPPSQIELAPKFLMYVTAYSSSEDETDSTPYITASGTRTRGGVVASNVFPFGTQLKIPELFGEQVFVVEDRMHRRFVDRIDVWMPSKWQALNFGKQIAEIEVMEL